MFHVKQIEAQEISPVPRLVYSGYFNLLYFADN